MNKEKFLKTELGSNMEVCIRSWDYWLCQLKNYSYKPMPNSAYKKAKEKAARCQAQWEVYQMALQQFYGIEYHFSRTDEYFGIVTEDESDWLFKVER